MWRCASGGAVGGGGRGPLARLREPPHSRDKRRKSRAAKSKQRAEGEAGREPVSEEPEKLSVWYRNNVLSEILHSPEYLKLRAV